MTLPQGHTRRQIQKKGRKSREERLCNQQSCASAWQGERKARLSCYGPDLTDVYQGLLLDEIEHVQILTLELTKAVVAAAEETNADEGGSVFAAGDLTAEKAGDGDGDNGQSEEKK